MSQIVKAEEEKLLIEIFLTDKCSRYLLASFLVEQGEGRDCLQELVPSFLGIDSARHLRML